MACDGCEIYTSEGTGYDLAEEVEVLVSLSGVGAGVGYAGDVFGVTDDVGVTGTGVDGVLADVIDVLVGTGTGVSYGTEALGLTDTTGALGSDASGVTDILADAAGATGTGDDDVSASAIATVVDLYAGAMGTGVGVVDDTLSIFDTVGTVGTGDGHPEWSLDMFENAGAVGTASDGLQDFIEAPVLENTGTGTDGVAADEIIDGLGATGAGVDLVGDMSLFFDSVGADGVGVDGVTASFDAVSAAVDVAEGVGYPVDDMGQSMYTCEVSTFGFSHVTVTATYPVLTLVDDTPVVAQPPGAFSMDGGDRDGSVQTGTVAVDKAAGVRFGVSTVWYESDAPTAVGVTAFTPSSPARHRLNGNARGRVKLGRGSSATQWRFRFNGVPLSLRQVSANVHPKSRRI